MTPKNRKIEKLKKLKNVDFRKKRVFDFLDHFNKEINAKSKKLKKSENFIFEKVSSKNENFQNYGLRSRGPRSISGQNLRQDIVRKLHF